MEAIKTETKGARERHGHARHRTSGLSPTYQSWQAMLRRCRDPRHPHFADYGGRGITVCERWRRFEDFLADMGERPAGKTLDRYPNRDGNYEPGNCRWATRREQQENRKNVTLIAFRGERHNVEEWSRRTGIRSITIRKRIERGWAPERALTESPDLYKERSHG